MTDHIECLKVDLLSHTGRVGLFRAKEINVPSVNGYIGILPKHAALVCELGLGKVTISLSGSDESETYFINGGYLNVVEDEVKLLLDTVEHKSSIDIERSKRAQDRANRHLGVSGDSGDIVRAQAALSRALYRLKVARSK